MDTSSRHPIIGVMGSHENAWEEYTVPLGKMIADHDYHLLTGAGAGVMTAVSKAFAETPRSTGINIGIIPTIDFDGVHVHREEYPNPHIDIPIVTPIDVKSQGDAMPYSRNFVNIMSSDAVVILPGSHGTQNEASLALKYNKPIVLFGPEREFEKFPEQPARTDKIEDVKAFLEKVCPLRLTMSRELR